MREKSPSAQHCTVDGLSAMPVFPFQSAQSQALDAELNPAIDGLIVESGGISIKVSEFELHQIAWKRQLAGKWDLVSRQVGLPSTAKSISTECCSDQQLFKRYICR